MRLSEPTTMITDYLLGALTLTWAIQLFRFNAGVRQPSRRLWACGFVATALASVLGGTFHGFRLHLSAPVAALLWRATLYCVGIASATMLSAVVVACSPASWRWPLLAGVGIKCLLFLVLVSVSPKFRIAMLDYAVAMFIILSFQVHGWFSRRDDSAPWMMGGLLVGLVASLVQKAGVTLHAQFNHNDLFHVVQIISFYLLYRGGRVLRTITKAHSS